MLIRTQPEAIAKVIEVQHADGGIVVGRDDQITQSLVKLLSHDIKRWPNDACRIAHVEGDRRGPAAANI